MVHGDDNPQLFRKVLWEKHICVKSDMIWEKKNYIYSFLTFQLSWSQEGYNYSSEKGFKVISDCNGNRAKQKCSGYV